MPAVIAHALFAEQVLRQCARRGLAPCDRDMALIGAQGPDVFFFHRALPWQIGPMGFRAGQEMHHVHPAALFQSLRRAVAAERCAPLLATGYWRGFVCHYAIDRAAHPFVLHWQKELHRQRPDYGRSDSAYHFCIESALDTLSLRRFTGRLIRDYPLTAVLPPNRDGRAAAFARLHRPVWRQTLHRAAGEEYLALAPGDMRQAMFWMTDKRGLRAGLLRGGETLCGVGAVATSLLRPQTADDWDYANLAHRVWRDPFTGQESDESFFDIWRRAADDAVAMLTAFADGRPTKEIVGDRDFTGKPYAE